MLNNKIIQIIVVLIVIFLLPILIFFSQKVILGDNLQDIINVFIGIIGGIVGITFSLLLMYIQNLSNNFSGGVYYIISKRKEPFITFVLFLFLIFVLIILNFNFFDFEEQLLLYYAIISIFLGLYFLWDLYRWSINNLPPLKIAEYFKEESNRKLKYLNKKLDKNINQDNKEIISFYFSSGSEKSLHYLYNSLLGGYIKMLNNNLLFDSKQIIEIFFRMLRDFLIIFNDKFHIHPDLNIVLGVNSTFTSFFAKLLIKVNRSCDDIVLPAKDYELLNSILYGYRDLILESLKIKFNGNNGLNDENPILSIILGQFNDLGDKIIKHKEYEGAFTYLIISQEIGIKIIESSYWINFISFLEGLEKFLTPIDIKYDNVLLHEFIKSYVCLLNQIFINPENLNYLSNYLGKILDGIKYLLVHKAMQQKSGADLQTDLIYQNIFSGIRELNILYLNGKIDTSDMFFNNDIRKFLEDFIIFLEFYKQKKRDIIDYVHIKWFCELLLNMLEDELEKGGDNNFFLYYQTIQKLTKLVINTESGKEISTVFDYQIKIFSLIIKYGLDDHKLYYKDFEELINLYENFNDKRYSFVEKIYKELSLILVLLKKEGKEFFGLDKLIKKFEISENKKMKDGYDGDVNDIVNYLFPITRYLLSYIDEFNRYENHNLIYSSFNATFDEWFIRKFNLNKDDFKKYLGVD